MRRAAHSDGAFQLIALDGRVTPPPAAGAGTVTAWFRQWGDGPIPFADAERDIAVALIYVDGSGDVRWARRIFGQPFDPGSDMSIVTERSRPNRSNILSLLQ